MSSSHDATTYEHFHPPVIRLHCTVSEELGTGYIFAPLVPLLATALQALGFWCNSTEAKLASDSAKYICFRSARDNRDQCTMTHSWTWSGQCLGNLSMLLCSFSAVSSVETKSHRHQQYHHLVGLFHYHKTVILLTSNWKSSFSPVFILPLQVSVSDIPMLRIHIKWIMSFCLSSLQETTD